MLYSFNQVIRSIKYLINQIVHSLRQFGFLDKYDWNLVQANIKTTKGITKLILTVKIIDTSGQISTNVIAIVGGLSPARYTPVK